MSPRQRRRYHYFEVLTVLCWWAIYRAAIASCVPRAGARFTYGVDEINHVLLQHGMDQVVASCITVVM